MNDASPPPGLLLVDDDPLICESLAFALGEQFDVHTAPDRRAATELLRGLDPVPGIALVDLGLPPHPHAPDEGFALIRELLALERGIKIMVLSGQNERSNIRHALTLGAVDFVAKPCEPELLKARLAHQLVLREAEQDTAGGRSGSEVLLGDSTVIDTLRRLVVQFADSPFPVLIEGESGSGKELVAACLHHESQRRDEPLKTLNCAAFNAELLEAQLFGHARGAFTGADTARSGFFEEAGSGTLLLDEVGDMPAPLQAKFLRVLENGEYYRLGETRARTSRARVIAATNRDLREAVRSGGFRADLYHRLSVLTVAVPPLRERGRDWQLLIQHFLDQYAGSIAPFELESDAAALLDCYGFPGNVRELRNIVIRLASKYPGQKVSAAMLGEELETALLVPAGSAAPDLGSARQELSRPGFRLDEVVGELERRYIEAALMLSDGNLSQAARRLGVNRTTLYSKIQRLGLLSSGN